jgi:hypothetical protein
MVNPLVDLIDLPLAWKRFKLDLPDRVFVQHTFELPLIEPNLEQWLEHVTDLVANNRYKPQHPTVCDVPKGRSAVRPGAYLRVLDTVMYHACVGACYPYIHTALGWAAALDFSYPLADSSSDVKWIKESYTGWKSFQNETIARIESGSRFVVFTDITGYYENIDLQTLGSDLRSAGAPEPAVVQLSACLNRWRETPNRGIPQGHAPSDILGKLYLDQVDEYLQRGGFNHIRYVDDYRVFCNSETEAKEALLELTRRLRRRGLNLQTSKTQILSGDAAKEKVKAITSKIMEIRGRLFAQREMAFEMGNPYVFDEFSLDVLNDDLENEDPDVAPADVIRHAYFEHISPINQNRVEGITEELDSPLFHFLLNKLGADGDDLAASHCLTLLATHPEETKVICKYLHRIGHISCFDDQLADYFESPENSYCYQAYQLIEWRLLDPESPTLRLFNVVRRWAFDPSKPAYLRSVCRKLVGRHGDKTDLDTLACAYEHAMGDLEQCELLCCIQRMEPKNRNSLLSRCEHDGFLHQRAVRFVKEGRI